MRRVGAEGGRLWYADFLAAELRVDCGLVDHASMLFEVGDGVKRARLWTLAKLKTWKDGRGGQV